MMMISNTYRLSKEENEEGVSREKEERKDDAGERERNCDKSISEGESLLFELIGMTIDPF